MHVHIGTYYRSMYILNNIKQITMQRIGIYNYMQLSYAYSKQSLI